MQYSDEEFKSLVSSQIDVDIMEENKIFVSQNIPERDEIPEIDII